MTRHENESQNSSLFVGVIFKSLAVVLLSLLSFTLGTFVGHKMSRQPASQSEPLKVSNLETHEIAPDSLEDLLPSLEENSPNIDADKTTQTSAQNPESSLPGESPSRPRSLQNLSDEVGLTEKSESVVFTVQVASTQKAAQAQELVKQLKNRGLPAFYYEAQVPSPQKPDTLQTWWRVSVGQFPSATLAEAKKQQWLSEKLITQGFVQKVPVHWLPENPANDPIKQ